MTNDLAQRIIAVLKQTRFALDDEKRLHQQMHEVLKIHFPEQVAYEYPLDKKNRIDFLVSNVGIEVKIKGGSKREIFKQCTRYCEFDQIESLILVTGIMTGFPEQIHGKDCYVVKLSQAWL